MSTSYYRLRPPITSLKLEKGRWHDRLWVWVNHVPAGKLVLDEDETSGLLGCFTLFEYDTDCPLRSYWGGDEHGCVVYSNVNDLPDDMQVISEYRELLTVREVRAKHGKGKKDVEEGCEGIP